MVKVLIINVVNVKIVSCQDDYGFSPVFLITQSRGLKIVALSENSLSILPNADKHVQRFFNHFISMLYPTVLPVDYELL